MKKPKFSEKDHRAEQDWYDVAQRIIAGWTILTRLRGQIAPETEASTERTAMRELERWASPATLEFIERRVKAKGGFED